MSGVTALVADDVELVRRLCAGDVIAFEALVSRYHAQMVRLARSFVADHAAAEDVAQEAWLGALRGIDRFEGRSTVKTWLFRIVVNCGKTRGVRDARCSSFSTLDREDALPANPGHHLRRHDPHETSCAPRSDAWRTNPEQAALTSETCEQIMRALDRLPVAQKTVVQLRDVDGFSASEVCDLLDLTEANQRVLLHRGRAKLRNLLGDLWH